MKNYELKIEEMRNELNKKECVVTILNKLHQQMEWDTMQYVEDESEEGHHFEEPDKDGWRYNDYCAYKDVIALIEKTYFK